MQHSLFPHEKIQVAGGYPCLTYFQNSKPELPLVVFVSGGPIMSRIAYGHSGGQSEDFLAYWIMKAGNPFLAVTHTMDHSIFPTTHPEFTIQDWGRQVAEVVGETVKQHKLYKEIIVIAFSAGGRLVEALSTALEPYEIKVEAFIALNALTPQLTLISQPKRGFQISPKGYAVASFDPVYGESLHIQESVNRRAIVNESTFKNDYIGNFPINVWESIYRYHREEFVPALEEGLNDSGAFAYFHYPLIGVITGDSSKDLRNTVMSSGVWGFYMTQSLYHQFFAYTRKDFNTFSEHNWKKVLDTVTTFPQKLSAKIEGGYFFFLGEKGAKATAAKIYEQVEKIRAVRAELKRAL